MASTHFSTEEVSDFDRLSMRNNNQLDYRVCHLTAHELIVALHPIARMRNAGHRTVDIPDLHTVPGKSRIPTRNSRNV
jgi:hypothetical protein